MGWRNVALVISILVTVASLVLVGVRGLNLGVDFVGGQMIRTTFAQPIDVERGEAIRVADVHVDHRGASGLARRRRGKELVQRDRKGRGG
jgi:preprotein translocase subunit SecF